MISEQPADHDDQRPPGISIGDQVISSRHDAIITHLEKSLGPGPSDQPPDPAPFRDTLAQASTLSRESFFNGPANWEDVKQLVRTHTHFMDQILQLAWHRFDWQESRTRWGRQNRISLIAVGGYGRGELLPESDIDLLILLERSHHGYSDKIQDFIRFLWDLGLEVGHSVRTINECRTQAALDVTVLTAMMESRTLCGDESLRAKMDQKIAPSRVWPSRDFFLAKRQEQRARHRKSDHTEYSLEPNIKISPGGLRDIQTLGWIARRQYGTTTFGDLAAMGVITDEEARELTEGKWQLARIRFALHLLQGRDDNRLLFEHQQKLAAVFGYEDGAQLAVEQFMQSYYRAAHRINAISDILLQYFDEALAAGKRSRVKPLNERFQLRGNFLEVTADDVFARHPSALIEMFTCVASDETIEGIRASTIRLARQSVHLIDDDFRQDPANAELFMQLLGGNNHLFTQLRRMGRYGILGAWLPEFGRVVGQMQFDLFHIYTVDAHTLQVVRNMRRFRYKNNEQEFPIAAHIHARLPRVELLYIAGLYHDIAKGMGGDHSELGVGIARQFCERHKLATWDTNLVCWLVLNHLAMSTTAQRRDIQDPDVIHEFAQLVGDQVRLDYLYALTVADITATNPTLWNGWRASLLNQLYLETKKVLRHGLDHQIDRNEYIHDIQEQAINKLAEHQVPRASVIALWNQVDDDYFLRERVPDIVRQTLAILNHEPGETDEPLVVVHDDISRHTDTGYTRIFVHTKNRSDLFVAIATAIDRLNLDIVDAGIATSSAGLTFNTFTVLEQDGTPVGESMARINKICATIKAGLSQAGPGQGSSRRTPRQLRQFSMKTVVSFRQDQHLGQTVVEVIAPDRPGLLAIIAEQFARFGLGLMTARITTLGERVEDLFYVTDANGLPVQDEQLLDDLRASLCEALDRHVSPQQDTAAKPQAQSDPEPEDEHNPQHASRMQNESIVSAEHLHLIERPRP